MINTERKFKVGNTVYQRSSKYGVGKVIGGKIYIHKGYADRIIDKETLEQAAELLPQFFYYNCIMYDPKKQVIRFDEAPDFDTEREPHPGDFIEVNLQIKTIRTGHSDFIWHHKWMWVDDNYEGFDVEKSYQWSKEWTQLITHPSGSKRVWLEQLKNIY